MNDDPRLGKTADLLKVLANPNQMRIVQLLGQNGELNVFKLMN